MNPQDIFGVIAGCFEHFISGLTIMHSVWCGEVLKPFPFVRFDFRRMKLGAGEGCSTPKYGAKLSIGLNFIKGI